MVRKYSTVFFILTVIVVSVYYSYPGMLFKRPQSIHAWRQADDASFALNYYQDGMHFFQPEVNNLTTSQGTSGKTAPGENTYLYYFVASLYHIFGYHEFIFRLVFTLIFLAGLFFLYKTTRYLFDDVFWAFALPLLLFSSPVIMYYGNNFLPNTPALAFVLTGWFFFFRYRKEKRTLFLYLTMLFFLLAAWLKITALLSLAAIGGIFILEWLFGLRISQRGKIFSEPLKFLILSVILILLVGVWVFFTTWYNRVHDSTYFVHKPFPFWTFSPEELRKVIYNIRHIWLKEYFHPLTLLFFVLTVLFIVFHLRKASRFLLLTNLFLLAGIAVFVMMFFWFFQDHDYYSINLYILPVFLFLTSLDILKKRYPVVFSSPFTKIIFGLFLLFNIWYAKITVQERYEGKANRIYQNSGDWYTITPWLRDHGIGPEDTVISVPDNTHVSLYLMNVKGWTQYTDTRFEERNNWIRYNRDRQGIEKSIHHGAGYLVVNGIETLFHQPFLQDYALHLTGRYGKILVFNLKEPTRNFTMPQQTLIQSWTCDAEHLTDDGRQFINPADSSIFEFAKNRSDIRAHSGSYSIALNK
ncbi:MAG TPA: glycosyltransferase family 39 protein, partial [Bacteroidales bacterium]|nr:glycosyltransferase family 39 protein [Bacteroidales bacterium]